MCNVIQYHFLDKNITDLFKYVAFVETSYLQRHCGVCLYGSCLCGAIG